MTNTARPHVLLIWPYGVKGAESIPMSFAFLAPPLQAVADVQVLDCSLYNLHPRSANFAQAVARIAPDVIGISAWSQNWRYVQLVIRELRDLLPSVPIVIGGPHVTATRAPDLADFALLGEAEHTFPELVMALARKAPGNEIENIRGVRIAGGQGHKTPRALVADLDALGLPDYDAMLLPEYQASGGYAYRAGAQRQAPILATRGCPYTCHFCEAPTLSGTKIRKHSVGYLRELLLHLRGKYGVTHINIVDDNFSYDPPYVHDFADMVLSEPKLAGTTFATPNGLRLDRSTPEMYAAMKRAGWSRVIFAPETGSQRLADIMVKDLDLSIVPERVEWARAAGLEVEAFFILNYPGETEDDIVATRDFIMRCGFDYISLHIFKPLPHTPIWRQLVVEQQLSPEYVVGRYDEIDWLANGRNAADIDLMVQIYNGAATVFRVA
jgi:anaerobic magnesium-protoporphyrin IX monomethyl ester cyclase